MILVAINIFAAAMIGAAWHHGFLGPIYDSDQTYLTWVISAGLVLGLMMVALGRDRDAKFISWSLVTLGLIGTVVGFVIALRGVSPDAAGTVEAIGPMVGGLVSGMGVALHPTLLGAGCGLWVEANRHVGY